MALTIDVVAALRETPVLFATLLRRWFLKEAFTPRRVQIGRAHV